MDFYSVPSMVLATVDQRACLKGYVKVLWTELERVGLYLSWDIRDVRVIPVK